MSRIAKKLALLAASMTTNEEEIFAPEAKSEFIPEVQPEIVSPIVAAAAEIVTVEHKKRGKQEIFSPAVGEAIRHLADAKHSFASASKWLTDNGLEKATLQNVRNYAKRHNIEFPGVGRHKVEAIAA